MQRLLGVHALPQKNCMTSFDYGSLKEWDLDRMAAIRVL